MAAAVERAASRVAGASSHLAARAPKVEAVETAELRAEVAPMEADWEAAATAESLETKAAVTVVVAAMEAAESSHPAAQAPGVATTAQVVPAAPVVAVASVHAGR